MKITIWKIHSSFHFLHTFVSQITFCFCAVIYRPTASSGGVCNMGQKRRKGRSYNWAGLIFIGLLCRKSLERCGIKLFLINKCRLENFTAFLLLFQHRIHWQYGNEGYSDCVSGFVSLYCEHQPLQTTHLCEWEHDMDRCTEVLQKVPWWPVHRQQHRSEATLCESKDRFWIFLDWTSERFPKPTAVEMERRWECI